MGIKHMVPSQELLEKHLSGMTLRRFNKLFSNTTKKELTATEVTLLTNWLSRISNKPAAEIQLLEVGKEVAPC
ncbi:hypothetical protein Q5H93_04495 [Hymenobacter sp. ASUV-10]|uniref:Uncharacterized protein n=1 Tax=Hymenobacter aranciens TaxID=3063996 RepID=A0ABT9B8J8_9BACT|nr:hypothetical protein [Hymenobacter sp. ASUV-10]MDO7873983.1 hypothetical protein [Hymenobacter sp. ASUV-10]